MFIKPYQMGFAAFLGLLAIAVGSSPVKTDTLFFGWMWHFPFVMLLIATGLYLVFNVHRFWQHRRVEALFPFMICMFSVLVVLWLARVRALRDASPTRFSTHTTLLGNDGGMHFDFRENGHLTARRSDHWVVTSYWGKYRQDSDTISIDLPIGLPFGDKAVLTDSTLRFIGSGVALPISRPWNSLYLMK